MPTRAGLTFAPEAGTQRLRDVINKGVTQEDIEAAVEAAFAQGWTSVKLYFMLGLPTETEEDLEGIARLAYRVRDIGRKHAGNRTKVKVSVGCLIPKPHAPFQWVGQEPYESVREKMTRLKRMVRGPGLSVGWHEPESSVLEAALARGDRRTAAVIHRAWRMGCRFDAWAEHFQFGLWREAFALEGMDIHAAAERRFSWRSRSRGTTSPRASRRSSWRGSTGRALEAELSPDCRDGKCLACGVRQSYGGC